MEELSLMLLEIDVNPSAIHINPDGEKISGSHLHVYTEEYDTAFAMPFDINNKDLYQLCYSFFKRFNIIEPPNVTHQLAMEEV